MQTISDVPISQEESSPPIERAPVRSTVASITDRAIPATHTIMLKEIRSWGEGLLVLGAVHVIASGFLSAPFGILFLIVGVMSFYFQSPAMFIVYATTLAWAAASNALSGQVPWIAFAVIQIRWAFQTYRQFLRYRHAQDDLAGLTNESDQVAISLRVPRMFPWAGCLIGAVALMSMLSGFVIAVALAVINASSGGNQYDLAFMVHLVEITTSLAVLGFALGLASLLSGFRYKALSVLGMLASGLTLIIFFALVVLSQWPPAVSAQ